MLPEGYRECAICSTPCHGEICGPCSAELSWAITSLGAVFYDYRPHKQWGIAVGMEWPDGKRTWVAHWTPVFRARQKDVEEHGLD